MPASFALSLLFASACALPLSSTRPHGITQDARTFSEQSFDYIVVGGGTAGLTVATRLAENPSILVGVVEAGTMHLDDPLIDTPGFLGESLFNPTYDWSFFTVPQANAGNRSLAANRGKLLGGSSGLNFMLWQRGSKGDYDAWSELGIGGGWNWEGLLPYFKKSEKVTPGPRVFPGVISNPGANGDEGRSGPIAVSYGRTYSDLEVPYVQSLQALGIPVNSDPDNGNSTGVFNCARAVDPSTGNRTYSTTNLLAVTSERSNLVILTGATVTKLLFTSPRTGKVKVTGVTFMSGDKRFTVSSNREVILSAGAVQTPQLLELSGIGGKPLLESFGIKNIVDLPGVGENLQDHTTVGSDFVLKNSTQITLDLLDNNPTFASEQSSLYKFNHTGLLTYTAAAVSFHPLQHFFSETELAAAVSQLEHELLVANASRFHRQQANIQLRGLRDGKLGQMELFLFPARLFQEQADPSLNRFSIYNFGSRLFSRGSIHINTSNPLAAPLIDPKYLNFAIDRQILVKGLQIARKLSLTPPLSTLVSGPFNPPANVTSIEDLNNFVSQTLGTEWHLMGTAALGPRSSGGVVDETLTVYGTENLRVVDASVIPMSVAAHLQATVYAIAEKGADIIKASQTIALVN